jgi:hypothetical protein
VVTLTESKLQGWRAVAVFADGRECLVYLGRSTTQVRANYAAAYAELLEDDEQRFVREVALECWQGAADAGRWIRKSILAIPSREPLPVAKDSAQASSPACNSSDAAVEAILASDEVSDILSFARPFGKTEKAAKRTHAVRVT